MYKKDYDRITKLIEKHYVGDTIDVFFRVSGLLEINGEYYPKNLFIQGNNIDVLSVWKQIPYKGIDGISLTWYTEPYKESDSPHRISKSTYGWSWKFSWKEKDIEILKELNFE